MLLTLTLESSSWLEKDIASRKSIASVDQHFEAVNVSASLVSPIKSNMSVLKECKLAEVRPLSTRRKVGSEIQQLVIETLLDNRYLTNLDIAIARDTNVMS